MIVMIMDISEFMVDATQQQPHQQQFDFDVPIANVIALTNIEKEMIIKRHTNANKSGNYSRVIHHHLKHLSVSLAWPYVGHSIILFISVSFIHSLSLVSLLPFACY